MKGIVGFNKLNDIIFYKADIALNNHLLRAAIKNGYITPEEIPQNGEVNRNLLVQIFSPLVTSQRVMLSQFDNVYSSVECDDDLCFIFIMIWSFQFIGISQKEDSLTECRRRLCICLELAKLICGPALHMLMDTGWEQNCQNEKALLLSDLMDMWDSLRQTELMFVVEGVERLLINRQLSNSCVKLVETVLSRMRAIQPANLQFCHAFLLVDNKLLSLYSSRNAGDLSKGDLLLLLVLVNVLHKNDQVDKEQDSPTPPIIVNSEELLKARTPSPIPKLSPRSSPKSFFARFMRGATTSDETFIPAKEVTESLGESSEESVMDFALRHCQVFLHARSGSRLPHWICSLYIDDHVKLVLVADTSTQVSRLLSSALELVYGIILAPPVAPPQAPGPSTSTPTPQNSSASTPADNPFPHWKSTLDVNFQKISDLLYKKGQGDFEERTLRSLVAKWENLKQAGFLGPTSQVSRQLPARLEIGLSSLGESLQEGIGSLLVQGAKCPLTTEIQAQLSSVGHLVQEKLHHCHQYLLVKAQRNLAITSYLQDYPGLLFFVYIDRNTGWLLTPSVSDCLQQQRQEYVALLTKDKVWSMIYLGLDMLRSGERLATLWQDQDFYYSHFIWFEDQAGTPLKPKQYPSLRHFPPPGIIAGDFYRRLTKECLLPTSSLCYELFCLHVGVSTPPLILEQARRLAAAVWDISGSAHMPLDLL